MSTATNALTMVFQVLSWELQAQKVPTTLPKVGGMSNGEYVLASCISDPSP